MRSDCVRWMRGTLALIAAAGGLATAEGAFVPLSPVTKVEAGTYFTCAIGPDARAYCWGRPSPFSSGLSIGRSTFGGVAGPVEELPPVADISVGQAHICAVTQAGAARCFGYGYAGQLGSGDSYTFSFYPTHVVGLDQGVAAITAGGDHTCALTVGGAAKCWGANQDGQLGDNSQVQANVPVDVTDIGSGATVITAGRKRLPPGSKGRPVQALGRRPLVSRSLDFFLAAVSGILLALSFPTFGHPAVAWVALAPLLVALAGATLPRALALGFVTGVIYFTGTLYWITRVMAVYGGLQPFVATLVNALLIVYLALFPALFALLVRRLIVSYGPRTLLAAPLVWISTELGRTYLLTGFHGCCSGTARSRSCRSPRRPACSVSTACRLSSLRSARRLRTLWRCRVRVRLKPDTTTGGACRSVRLQADRSAGLGPRSRLRAIRMGQLSRRARRSDQRRNACPRRARARQCRAGAEVGSAPGHRHLRELPADDPPGHRRRRRPRHLARIGDAVHLRERARGRRDDPRASPGTPACRFCSAAIRSSGARRRSTTTLPIWCAPTDRPAGSTGRCTSFRSASTCR